MSQKAQRSLGMSRKKKNGGRKGYVLPLSPPLLTTSVIFAHTFRWQCTGTAGVSNSLISTGMIMDSLVMAVTTQATFSIFDAFKLKRVNLWAPASSSPGFNTTNGVPFINPPVIISLELNGGGAGNVGTKPTRLIDTSMGATRNACLTIKPPKDSAASQWQVIPESGSATVGTGIIVNCPNGSIMDIELVLQLQNNSAPNAGPTAGAALLTVGTLYQAPIDGTNGNWLALGAPTYLV